jgi:hypothetical protein
LYDLGECAEKHPEQNSNYAGRTHRWPSSREDGILEMVRTVLEEFRAEERRKEAKIKNSADYVLAVLCTLIGIGVFNAKDESYKVAKTSSSNKGRENQRNWIDDWWEPNNSDATIQL